MTKTPRFPMATRVRTTALALALLLPGVAHTAARAACTPDATPPAPIAKLIASATDGQVLLEWISPADSDFDGVLWLRREGAAVDDVPVDGQSYAVGQTVGASTVVCVTTASDTSCLDSGATNLSVWHYSGFAFDCNLNYAAGQPTRGYPRAATEVSWATTTGASSLNPVGLTWDDTASANVIAVGNDQLMHRFSDADGHRGSSWDPPQLSGAVQSRPMVGDLDPGDGTLQFTVFMTSQNGRLYRRSADASGANEMSVDVAAQAGCPGGMLQAGPIVQVDAYDNNTIPDENTVTVVTRCPDVDGDGTLNDNKVMVYSHDLQLLDSYDGDDDYPGEDLKLPTLGIGNATPRLLYRDNANNLIYVPLREDGDDRESLLVLRVLTDHTLAIPPYSEVTGIGDIDASPTVFRFGNSNNHYLLLGNTDGVVYLYDAVNRVGPLAPDPLIQRDTFTTFDGPVKGIAVSSGIGLGNGLYEHWAVWTTDGTVHGVKIVPGSIDFKDSSYWSVAIPDPSAPLVLRYVGGTANTRAYVGSSDGRLYELDATTGNVTRSWLLEAGKTIGEPTFDYNDGVQQGIVVGSTSGVIHRVVLD